MCVVAGYSRPLEGSDALQTTLSVVELDVALFHDMFVFYHQTTHTHTKKGFFSTSSRIFKLAAAVQRSEGGGAEGGAATGAAGGGATTGAATKAAGGWWGVSVNVLPLRHTSHSFLQRCTPPFFPNHLVR